ncbi:hypothetical protein SERLA73DRAFT_154423 [Serpula lacrymans var. lacrymans S7.3]|uniref:Uncharacterized protein n=1 Tax=Serpula lacrymans var. lacrymans (strain S7.3) TaxID=936435 RepID=F8Q5P1_SERL3|nr:hypothetical protein SERLA73DRAFT_154423 [Serpula lacrymans var. lacrymans S7.3]
MSCNSLTALAAGTIELVMEERAGDGGAGTGRTRPGNDGQDAGGGSGGECGGWRPGNVCPIMAGRDNKSGGGEEGFNRFSLSILAVLPQVLFQGCYLQVFHEQSRSNTQYRIIVPPSETVTACSPSATRSDCCQQWNVSKE